MRSAPSRRVLWCPRAETTQPVNDNAAGHRRCDRHLHRVAGELLGALHLPSHRPRQRHPHARRQVRADAAAGRRGPPADLLQGRALPSPPRPRAVHRNARHRQGLRHGRRGRRADRLRHARNQQDLAAVHPHLRLDRHVVLRDLSRRRPRVSPSRPALRVEQTHRRHRRHRPLRAETPVRPTPQHVDRRRGFVFRR